MATHATVGHPPVSLLLRQWILRHPVLAFLLLTYTFAWGSMVPVLLSNQGLGVVPIDLPVPLFQLVASYIGLALPAFLVSAAIGGWEGVQDLVRRSLRWRVAVHWYLIALFVTLAGVLALALPFFGVAPAQQLAMRAERMFTILLPGILVMFLTLNLPEEVAWTGFLQSHLQGRRGPLLASLLTAPAFALVHLPPYFIDGWVGEAGLSLSQIPEALVSVGVVAVFALFFRPLVMWLYNGSGSSVLIVALFHSAFNMTHSQMTPQLVSDPTAAALLPLVVIALVAIAATVATKGKLGQRASVSAAADGKR
jgi:uncharacterized protein